MRRHHERGVDDGLRDAFLHLGERFVADAGQDVAAQHKLRFAGGDARRVELVGRIGDAHMRNDGAVFLRKSGHVQHADAFALDMRRHAEQRTDRDDAGAADARHQNSIRLVCRRMCGIGERGKVGGLRSLRLAQLPAFDGDKARAEAVHARIVFVARRLVDRPFAAELGFDRRDRYAIRLDAAIAAAFAHQLVDEHAARWIGKFAALAATAFLGRTRLVIQEDRAPGHFTQLALHLIEIVAMMDLDVAREIAGRIFVGLVADDDDLLHAFRGA